MRRRSGAGVAAGADCEATEDRDEPMYIWVVELEVLDSYEYEYECVELPEPRVQKLPLLQSILRRSLEMVPLMCPPNPQSVSNVLGLEKLPLAPLPS
jgi:hypothetical protein